MNGRNLVILVLSIFILALAGLSFTFWKIWNGKTQTAKGEIPVEIVVTVAKDPEKSTQMKIKREDLTEALVVELKKEKGDRGYDLYDIEIQAENDQWIRVLLLGFYDELPTELSDPYLFLVRKDKEGNISAIALAYTSRFTQWLEETPEDILSTQSKAFYR